MVFSAKILLLGDGSVGKTSLVHRYVEGKFQETYKATIGVDLFQKDVQTDKGILQLQVWDIAGQSVFASLRKKFFSKARGALLVFDLTMPSTFESLSTWINDLVSSEGEVPIVLIGNKMDLTDLRAINKEEIMKFVKETPIIREYFETSAKLGYNVNQAFTSLGLHVLEGMPV